MAKSPDASVVNTDEPPRASTAPNTSAKPLGVSAGASHEEFCFAHSAEARSLSPGLSLTSLDSHNALLQCRSLLLQTEEALSIAYATQEHLGSELATARAEWGGGLSSTASSSQLTCEDTREFRLTAPEKVRRLQAIIDHLYNEVKLASRHAQITREVLDAMRKMPGSPAPAANSYSISASATFEDIRKRSPSTASSTSTLSHATAVRRAPDPPLASLAAHRSGLSPIGLLRSHPHSAGAMVGHQVSPVAPPRPSRSPPTSRLGFALPGVSAGAGPIQGETGGALGMTPPHHGVLPSDFPDAVPPEYRTHIK